MDSAPGDLETPDLRRIDSPAGRGRPARGSRTDTGGETSRSGLHHHRLRPRTFRSLVARANRQAPAPALGDCAVAPICHLHRGSRTSPRPRTSRHRQPPFPTCDQPSSVRVGGGGRGEGRHRVDGPRAAAGQLLRAAGKGGESEAERILHSLLRLHRFSGWTAQYRNCGYVIDVAFVSRGLASKSTVGRGTAPQADSTPSCIVRTFSRTQAGMFFVSRGTN